MDLFVSPIWHLAVALSIHLWLTMRDGRLLVSEVNRYLEDDEEGTRAAIVFKEDAYASAPNHGLTISTLNTQLTDLEAEVTQCCC